MAKVITFSRKFPAQHPKKGEPTFFVEKVLKSFMKINGVSINEVDALKLDESVYDKCKPKHHTIRAGCRFKEGDKFSPRIWSGKPYQSKQIILADDIEIKKTYNVQIEFTPSGTMIMLPTERHSQFQLLSLGEVARNDGLTIDDFENWFNPKKKDMTFQGQIICWNENINY